MDGMLHTLNTFKYKITHSREQTDARKHQTFQDVHIKKERNSMRQETEEKQLRGKLINTSGGNRKLLRLPLSNWCDVVRSLVQQETS
ncbi:hypothetical protein ACF0H5_018054 [Mactra antiquata]